MQIDQNILNVYNESKSNLESITQRFIDIVTKDVVISENLFYKIVLSNSSYQRVQILFFKNKESMQKHNSFKTDRYKTKKEEGKCFCLFFNCRFLFCCLRQNVKNSSTIMFSRPRSMKENHKH